VGHNIANANTVGFSRQQAVMITSYPDNVPSLNSPSMHGLIGTGVMVNDIARLRNEFYDRQYRDQNIQLGNWEHRSEQLSRLEILFNEGTDSGLSSVYDLFWQSWQELSKTPESLTVRTMVRQRGQAVVDTMNDMYKQLKNYRSELNQTLIIKKDEINAMARQIGDLNGQIQDLEIAGGKANDLHDKRDLLLDQLSSLVNIRIEQGTLGQIRVSLGDYDLVDGLTVNKLEVKARNESERGVILHDLYWAGTGEKLIVGDLADLQSGALRAIIDMRDGDNSENAGIPYYVKQLDMLAYQTITRTNNLYREGYGLVDNQVLSVNGGEQVTWSEVGLGADVEAGRYRVEMISNSSYKVLRYQEAPESVYEATGGEWIEVGSGQLGAEFNSGPEGLTFTISGTAQNGNAWQFSVVKDGIYPPRLGNHNFFNEIDTTNLDSVISVDRSIVGDAGLKRISASLEPDKAGDGDNALRLAGLKQVLAMGQKEATYNDFMRSMAGKLGVDTQEAKRMAENQALLVQQVDGLRQGVSSVSLDEEMTNMIKFQHAYNAAARLITSVDEMIDVLVNKMGIVGR
jgi:flagellar hook-associated protein 1 FlgK